MCYEQRYFNLWGTKKAQKRAEIPTEIERKSPSTETSRQPAKAKQREKVERELEPV